MENFIEILKSVLYGIVEGITEWLHISSTGHMILLEELLPMKVSESFWEMFLVVIQLGAILAVVVLYWNKIFPFNFRNKNRPFLRYDVFQLWFKILVACIPAAIVGLLFDDWLNAHLYNAVVVAIMLVLVGIAFIIIENRNRGRRARVDSMHQLSFGDAFIIGLFQLIAAIFPGTSRRDDHRRAHDRHQPYGGRRVYFLSGHSGQAGRQPAQAGQVRSCLYHDGARLIAGRHGSGFHRFDPGHPLPHELHQEA